MIEHGLLRCPSCGNDGSDDDAWTTQAPVPFRLVERVLRSWHFDTVMTREESWFLDGDTDSDAVDWESGDGLRVECCSCFEQFPIPEGFEVDFDRNQEPLA